MEPIDKKGILILVPTGIGNESLEHVLPALNFSIVNDLMVFIVENLRSARRFLKKAGYPRDFQQVTFFILNKHTPTEALSSFLQPAYAGKNIGLLSEAGVPCVADPGSDIVKLAHQLSIQVLPLIGPSSIILALMASGFNGQKFEFHGYLPVNKPAREKTIRELENKAIALGATQIFIETPYRNIQMFHSLTKVCKSQTSLCIAANIAQPDSNIQTKSIKEWRKTLPDIHKKPVVFLIH